MDKHHSFLQKLTLVLVVLLAVVSLTGMVLLTKETTTTKTQTLETKAEKQSLGTTGNGGPSGTHYQLNIHAKKSNWSPGEMGASGNNLFIREDIPCKVNLIQDTTFSVTDSDCSDGVAEYHMPAPTTAENPNNTLYSVFMRPLGKPGGQLTMQSCAMYDDDNNPSTPAVELCSTDKMSTVRMKGRSTFVNVSPALLSLVVSLDGGVTYVRVPLFDTRYPQLDGYMWNTQVDAKLVQLRFYPGVMTALQ